MRAGKLKRRITIERLNASQDSSGEETRNWEVLTTMYSSIVPVSDREKVDGASVESDVTHKITIRYQAALDLTSKDRIIYGNRTFEISGIFLREEAFRTMDLMCIERVA